MGISNHHPPPIDHQIPWWFYLPFPKDSILFNYFISRGFEVVKRSRLLGEVTRDTLCLAVAGTHGKTTTGGHSRAFDGCFRDACDSILGRHCRKIILQFHSSRKYLFGGGNRWIWLFIFAICNPDIACVASMDSDHLDILWRFGCREASFKAFAALVKDPEKLLVQKDCQFQEKRLLLKKQPILKREMSNRKRALCIRFKTPTETIKTLKFLLPGHHNLLNAVTIFGYGHYCRNPQLRPAQSFVIIQRVERRFSYKIKTEHLVLIDDSPTIQPRSRHCSRRFLKCIPTIKNHRVSTALVLLYPRFCQRFCAKPFPVWRGGTTGSIPCTWGPNSGSIPNWLLGQISNPKKS